MFRLVFIGDPQDSRALLDVLPDGDFSVTIASETEAALDAIATPPQTIVLAALNGGIPLPRLLNTTLSVPWLAWNRLEDTALSVAAYERGALAVLPASVSTAGLERALRAAVARAMQPHSTRRFGTHGVATHARGTRIDLHDDEVLVVEDGIIATTVLHDDGTEVLVGLSGAGQILLGHPHDSCCLQLRAHTDARVVVQPWSHVIATPKFAEKLRARVRYMEAWASIQARPRLDDRLVGLLSLLAEQFGHAHQHGTLVDVRATHAQLATAVGATRATITRVFGRLRRQRLVFTDGDGLHERFVLGVVEHLHHS